jgi:hypothetical protein
MFGSRYNKYHHKAKGTCKLVTLNVYDFKKDEFTFKKSDSYHVMMEAIIKQGYHDITKSVITFVKCMYLNPEFPQNQTIKKLNKRSFIFSGETKFRVGSLIKE